MPSLLKSVVIYYITSWTTQTWGVQFILSTITMAKTSNRETKSVSINSKQSAVWKRKKKRNKKKKTWLSIYRLHNWAHDNRRHQYSLYLNIDTLAIWLGHLSARIAPCRHSTTPRFVCRGAFPLFWTTTVSNAKGLIVVIYQRAVTIFYVIFVILLLLQVDWYGIGTRVPDKTQVHGYRHKLSWEHFLLLTTLIHF